MEIRCHRADLDPIDGMRLWMNRSSLSPRQGCAGGEHPGLMRLNLLHSSVWARPITSVWRQMVRGSQLSIEPNSQLFGLRSNRANADMDSSLALPASCPAFWPSLLPL